MQLILNIEDVNDNAPQFVHSKYEARLQENQSDFDSPLIVEARDLDLNGMYMTFLMKLTFICYGFALNIVDITVF